MRSKAGLWIAILLALTACEKDPDTACFDNGEHEKMSDGRIKRICDCALGKVRVTSMTEKEKKVLVAVIEGDKVEKELAVHATVLRSTWQVVLGQCKEVP